MRIQQSSSTISSRSKVLLLSKCELFPSDSTRAMMMWSHPLESVQGVRAWLLHFLPNVQIDLSKDNSKETFSIGLVQQVLCLDLVHSFLQLLDRIITVVTNNYYIQQAQANPHQLWCLHHINSLLINQKWIGHGIYQPFSTMTVISLR
jgi:hypothetical protein